LKAFEGSRTLRREGVEGESELPNKSIVVIFSGKKIISA
jgi:hypothetical protein